MAEFVLRVKLQHLFLSSKQKQFPVVLNPQDVFHRGPNLRQGPGISDEMVYGSIILEKTNTLYIEGDLVSGRQDDSRMHDESDGRASAYKGNPPVHDNQVWFDGDVHLGYSLMKEHIVVSMEDGSIGEMDKPHGEL